MRRLAEILVGSRGESLSARLLGNTSWLVLDRLVRLGSGLLVGVWVARYLGPSRFGLLNYAQALVGLLAVLGALGLERIVVRDLVAKPEAKGEVLATAMSLRLVGGAFAWLASVALVILLNPDSRESWGLVAILGGSVLFQASDVFDYWFQSRIESRHVVLARSSAYLVATGARVGLILLQAPLLWFAMVLTLEALLAAGTLTYAYLRAGESFSRWRVEWSRARALLMESWPLVLSGLAVVVYLRIDQLMLQSLSGPEAVGIYSASVRLSEIWYFVPMAVVSSAMPSIVEAKKLGVLTYEARNMQLFRALVIMSLVISLAVSLAGPWVIQALYGETYASATPVLVVHAWTLLFVSLSASQGPWMVTEGLTMMVLRRALAGALVNLVLNLLFLRKYGPMAAAVNTLVAQTVAAVFVNAFSRRSRPMFLMQMRALLFWRA